MNLKMGGYYLAVCILGLLFATSSAAQTQYSSAREAAARAQQLIEAEEFSEAGELLSNLHCRDDVNCETLRQFSRGFLYEAWAGANPDNSSVLFDRAVEFYRDAGQLSPGNVQILTNLALAARSSGDLVTASTTAEQLVSLDPAKAYEHALFLGDLLLEQGDQVGAMHAYQGAIELDGAKPEARRRALNLLIVTGNSNEVFSQSTDSSDSFPEIAALGFRAVINAEFNDDTRLSELALVRWARLRANLGQLGEAELASLPHPEVWPSRGITELQQLVSADKTSFRWWQKTPERQDAISRVLRRRAATLRATATSGTREQQQTALKLLSSAVKIAPRFQAYRSGPLENSSNAQLDAATDLITLHHDIKAGGNYSELSGVSSEELERMTARMFEGKAGAYAAGQLEAIQRYHTVLGMVYYESGRDQSDWADNATYQLRHALLTSTRIADEEPTLYKPLPELQQMLATVYFRLKEFEKSASRSLDAAMGFLETDNLAAAANALKLAANSETNSSKTKSVARILRSRELLLDTPARAAEVTGNTVELSSEFGWLLKPAELNLSTDFVARQQFKTLSDLGTAFYHEGHIELSRELNAMAFQAARKQEALTSLQDLRRIQAIDSSLSKGGLTQGASQRPRISRQLEDRRASVNGKVWALPMNTGSISVQTDQQLSDTATTLLDQNANRTLLRVDREM
jgi:hypothetical protein